ncbi:MAG: hypothetical protein OXP36_08870 [Gammaproteobacteria bacterium]|nr:hypothetical protein [Gammaproteobacteria bacterium]
MTYRARIAGRELVRPLDDDGAVVIQGVKAYGRTATARHVAAVGDWLRMQASSPVIQRG